MIANGQKLAALSRVLNGRSPSMWQIEFTDHVTWCSTHTLTRPAQNIAVTPPQIDQLSSPPRIPGTTNESNDHNQNRSSTLTIALSLSRSGANRSALLWSRSNNQPK